MKSYLTILAALMLTLAVSSCNKAEKKIRGTWKATKVVQSDCTDPDDNITLEGADLDCSDNNGCFEFTMVFKDDGTSTTSVRLVEPSINYDETTTDSGIYNYDGTTVEFCDSDGANCESSPMSIDGDVATLTFTDSDCKYTYTLTKQ